MFTKTYLVLVLYLVMALPACRGKAPETETIASEQVEAVTPGDTTYLVREDVVALVEAPGRHVERARRHFLLKEREESAGELRAAAELLLRRASVADEPAKLELSSAAQEMESLAERLMLGPEVTPREFDTTVARTYRALASYHRQCAEDDWALKQVVSTALQLNTASVYLEQATEHVAESPDEAQSVEAVVQQTETLARTLAEGRPYAQEDVQKVFVELGQEIDHLGQRLNAAGSS